MTQKKTQTEQIYKVLKNAFIIGNFYKKGAEIKLTQAKSRFLVIKKIVEVKKQNKKTKEEVKENDNKA